MSKKKCQATKGREGEKEEVQNGEGQKEESLSNEEMRMRWAKECVEKREKHRSLIVEEASKADDI